LADVLILIGSNSDREYLDGVDRLAEFFAITLALEVVSAHRQPLQLRERLAATRTDGTRIIVAAAGMAAHLAGVCAAESLLPVIGVPLPGSALKGIDALLATVQMPSGVPVATMAIGKAGAQNAVIFAARIMALNDPRIAEKLVEFQSRGSRL
jgi:phosphoribosylaminoimidazole carboxylase PurE protein